MYDRPIVLADDGPMNLGGYLAVELALSGQEVCVVACGAHC
jgi:hypothetical protein